ncbi:MAG: creatininase family protein [Acetobacteraceae bacterium]
MEEWRRTHEWGALTRDEIRQARDAGALAVLTVGSCEQHGDHLPVNTDTVSAYEVAMRAAAMCEAVHALVLPPPSFGFSPHHRAWPGTVTLSLNTFLALVTDVAESVHRTGFDRLLVVNGHGGNQGPLVSICTDLVSRGLRVAAVTYFSPGQASWTADVPGDKKTVGHACAYETSIQLALRPEERQRIAGRIDGLRPRLAPGYVESGENPLLDTGATYAALFPAGDPGYYGDPAASTVAAGAMLLEKTVAGLAGFYAKFAAARLKVGAP